MIDRRFVVGVSGSKDRTSPASITWTPGTLQSNQDLSSTFNGLLEQKTKFRTEVKLFGQQFENREVDEIDSETF